MEADSINVEKYFKEIAALVADLTMATGRIFEQEPMWMINIVTSIHPSGVGGGNRSPRGIMEHKVIQNLRAVSGDKGLVRPWHQKFTTALGQVKTEYEGLLADSPGRSTLGERWRTD